MPSFGDFDAVSVTFVDADYPAISATNLNNVVNLLEELDTEAARSQDIKFKDYLPYFAARNWKPIVRLNDSADWTGAGTVSLSNDDTYSPFDHTSLRLTETNDTAGTMEAYQTGLSIDLTKFADEITAASTAMNVMWIVYVSDSAYCSSITIRLGTDSSNYFSVTYSPAGGLSSGYNTFMPEKTTYSSTGSPDWSTINYISLRWASASNASGEYVNFNLLQMTRPRDGSTYIPGCWTLDDGAGSWTNEIAYSYGHGWPSLVYNYLLEKMGSQISEPVDSIWALELTPDFEVYSFVGKFEWGVVEEDEVPEINWISNGSNYISVYVSSGTLYIDENVGGAGVATVESQALTSPLYRGQKCYLYIEKVEELFRVIFKCGNQATIILEHETTITTAGYICMGSGNSSVTSNAGLGILTDYSISHTQVNQLSGAIGDEDIPTVVCKKEDTTRSSTTTVAQDPELSIHLQPNTTYELSAKLFVEAESVTPGVKIDWEKSDGSGDQIGYRLTHGPGQNATATYSDEARMCGYAYSSDISYGVDGSRASGIYESFVYRTRSIGAEFTIRWAQSSSSSDSVTLKKQSYIKAQKVN